MSVNDELEGDLNQNEDSKESGSGEDKDMHNVIYVSGMYKDWFLDYASYVILERAVPALEDGLKPVQRRILHSMEELEDGRYNKVANVIGHCMKYHPHGDASIGDAMVQIGQKDLLIDMQGNWGNILTGDGAAAARYIEARLSKFALDVIFSPKITNWQLSYDGRNKEPVTLPVKFPLLLAQGVEGIAVGLACKILPHNFIELIDGCIDVLRGKKTHILPDFPTGGMMDASNYNEGLRGGKIRCRAKITATDKKTLVITEIPFGTTTTSLIDSILLANEKGKIKIRKVEDNTAEHVEIVIHLQPGFSPDKTIDALYAFSACEVPISPNAGVIYKDKPLFMGVNEMLKESAFRTVDLLKFEQEIRLKELQESWQFSSLEKIFIKEEMYIDFKKYADRETLYQYLYKCFEPHKKLLLREINDSDLERLTKIQMIRITRFDSIKADELIKGIEDEMTQVKNNIEHIIEFSIEFYKTLKKKYGKGRERKTEIKQFDNIVAARVAVANVKLYVNREEGFVGFGLKKDEYICDCSDIDDVIVFREDGKCMVVKISDKAFVGKNIIHVDVFKKNDNRTTYNMVYQDGTKGPVMMKRFAVTGVTRDKEYDLTKGTKSSSVLYFTANPNGEAEVLTVSLKPLPKLKKLLFEVDFGQLTIKGRNSRGNILSKTPVKKIVQKAQGVSTLGARKIWFDETVQRLNDEARGTFLGSFTGEDKVLTIMQTGEYRLTSFDLSNHFDQEMVLIEKLNPDKAITAVYWDAEKKEYYVKRFLVESSEKKVLFISEAEGSYLELVTTHGNPIVEVKFAKLKDKELPNEEINLNEFIDVKGLKAKGKRLTNEKVKEVNFLPQIDSVEENPEYATYELVQEDQPVELELSTDYVDIDSPEESSSEKAVEVELDVKPSKPKVITPIVKSEKKKIILPVETKEQRKEPIDLPELPSQEAAKKGKPPIIKPVEKNPGQIQLGFDLD